MEITKRRFEEPQIAKHKSRPTCIWCMFTFAMSDWKPNERAVLLQAGKPAKFTNQTLISFHKRQASYPRPHYGLDHRRSSRASCFETNATEHHPNLVTSAQVLTQSNACLEMNSSPHRLKKNLIKAENNQCKLTIVNEEYSGVAEHRSEHKCASWSEDQYSLITVTNADCTRFTPNHLR